MSRRCQYKVKVLVICVGKKEEVYICTRNEVEGESRVTPPFAWMDVNL